MKTNNSYMPENKGIRTPINTKLPIGGYYGKKLF